jgi:hypothetical protein
MTRQLSAILTLACLVLVGIYGGRDFLAQQQMEPLYPSAHLSESHLLSEWNPALEGTRADSEVYLFRGSAAGGRVLVLGGAHPNEPAGYLAAVLLLENIDVSQGEVWVLPRANASAFTATDPQEGHPQCYLIKNQAGVSRRFRMGGRLSNPLDQWPDPEITLHHPSGQTLAGSETRNLNRCFPGRQDGTITEGIAAAIHDLIVSQKIDLLIDLHEASIEYPVINAIVSHERAGDLSAMAVFELEMNGLSFSLEPSPKKLRGLSHRELGDAVEGLHATLMESANPIQGRLRGKTGVAQILSGKDPCYRQAQKIGMNQVDYPEEGIPIERRVMRHLEGFKALCEAWNMLHFDRPITLGGLPDREKLLEKGLSPWLAGVSQSAH